MTSYVNNKYKTVLVDVVAVSEKQKAMFDKLTYDEYWQLAFSAGGLPLMKESYIFGLNSPAVQKLASGSKFWEKCQKEDYNYIYIVANLPAKETGKKSLLTMKPGWKVAVPISHNSWFGLNSEKVDIEIFKDIILKLD